jgi:hypothetical protein
MVREHIAAALGITDDTLRKHYPEDLEAADDEWEQKFEASIKTRVLRDDCPPALVIFTAKVKLGWRELTPKDPDRVDVDNLTDDQLSEIIGRHARESRGRGEATKTVRAA